MFSPALPIHPHMGVGFSEVAAVTADMAAFSPIDVGEIDVAERRSRTSMLLSAALPAGAAPRASDSASKFSQPSGRPHARFDSNAENFPPPDISAAHLPTTVAAASVPAPAAPGGAPTGRQPLSPGRERSPSSPDTSCAAMSACPALIPGLPTPFSSPAPPVGELPDPGIAASPAMAPPDRMFAFSSSISLGPSVPSFRGGASDPGASPSSACAEASSGGPRSVARVPCAISAASDGPASSGIPAAVVPPPVGLSSPGIPATIATSSQPGHSGSGGGSGEAAEWDRSIRKAGGRRTQGAAKSNSSPLESVQKEQKSRGSCPPTVPTADVLPRRGVAPGEKGEGWPYAPQGWPEPDDVWLWKVVGKRAHESGYYRDRALGLPKRLSKGGNANPYYSFYSKKSIEEYLGSHFPETNAESFFNSFVWRVPIARLPTYSSAAGSKGHAVKRPREGDEDVHGSPKRPKPQCQAGNRNCGLETGRSLLLAERVSACDVCCSEPGFCRECKCILCCKVIVPDEIGESSVVRCRQRLTDDGICGHAAHLDCALHSKMAGVVGVRGLDIEYLCRRCDKKSDMLDVVAGLLDLVLSFEEGSGAEGSLNLALQLIKGTDRGADGAMALESLVQTALGKVRCGADTQDVYMEVNDQGAAAEATRQPDSARFIAVTEDAAQEPEASLDQWLQERAPSSHPSPETPSSLSPPRKRCCSSVTSGQPHAAPKGTESSNGNPSVTSGQPHPVPKGTESSNGNLADVAEDPQASPDVHSRSKYLRSVRTVRSTGQAGGGLRIHALSSAVDDGDHDQEAIWKSRSFMTPGNRKTGPAVTSNGRVSSRPTTLHSSCKDSQLRNQKEQRSFHPRSAGGGGGGHAVSPHLTETCKSCGTVKQLAGAVPVEVTSRQTTDASKHAGGAQGEEVDASPRRKTGAEPPGANGRRPGPRQAAGKGADARRAALQRLDSQCAHDARDALQKLRASQEAEFERAKERLDAQREAVSRQYDLLEVARVELSEQPIGCSLEAFDQLLDKTSAQFVKAQEARQTFNAMLKVADGFARVSGEDVRRFYASLPEKGK